MTDELDPQTQQHIDHSADAVDDCDTPTCIDASTDAPATAMRTPMRTRQQTQTILSSMTKASSRSRTTPSPIRNPPHKQRAPSRCLRKKSSMPSWTP